MKKTSRKLLTRVHRDEGGWTPIQVVAGLAIGVMILGGVLKLGGKVYRWASGETDTMTEHVGKTQQGFGLVDGEAVEVNPQNNNTHPPQNHGHGGHHGNNDVIIMDPAQGVSGGGSPM